MIKKCFIALLFSATLATSSLMAQNLKVAVIDMNQVLKEYYKTAEIDDRLKEAANVQQKELNERRENFTKIVDNVNKLVEELKDKTLSETARKEKEALLEQKRREAMAREQDNNNFIRTATNLLQEQRRRMTEGVMGEIGKVVNDISKAKGYNLVFVKTEFPGPVLYSDVAEITQDIIKELNKDKPKAGAATSAPTPAPDAKKKP